MKEKHPFVTSALGLACKGDSLHHLDNFISFAAIYRFIGNRFILINPAANLKLLIPLKVYTSFS